MRQSVCAARREVYWPLEVRVGSISRFPDVGDMSGRLVIPDKPFSGAFMSSPPSRGPAQGALAHGPIAGADRAQQGARSDLALSQARTKLRAYLADIKAQQEPRRAP